MRVPGIAWMPGKIKPAVVNDPASSLDLFPTALALAGVTPPKDVTLDGLDLAPVLFDQKPLPERPYVFYRGTTVFACRLGDWKAHFRTQNGYGGPKVEAHEPPLLFRLPHDPGEKFNVAAEQPEVLARIAAAVATHRATVVPAEPQLK